MSEAAQTREVALRVNELYCESDRDISGGGGLNNISFSFGKKGIHGILAPKDSGKTRLMDIIAGCSAADSGDVSVCGISVNEWPLDAKKKIGYVPKNSTFYSGMTATEILNFVGQTRGVDSGKLYRQIKEASELVGIDDIKNRLVKNMNEFEKKKLAIAAALLGNPELLLFDETVTPKMSETRKDELMGLLRMLGRLKTVVITTDDYRLARELCEDVVMLSDGQVLAKGSFDALEEKIKASDKNASLEMLYNSLVSATRGKRINTERGE